MSVFFRLLQSPLLFLGLLFHVVSQVTDYFFFLISSAFKTRSNLELKIEEDYVFWTVVLKVIQMKTTILTTYKIMKILHLKISDAKWSCTKGCKEQVVPVSEPVYKKYKMPVIIINFLVFCSYFIIFLYYYSCIIFILVYLILLYS